MEENKAKQLLKHNKRKRRKISKPMKPKMLKIKPCLDFLNPPLELKPSSSLPLLRISIDRDPDEKATSSRYRRLQGKPKLTIYERKQKEEEKLIETERRKTLTLRVVIPKEGFCKKELIEMKEF